MNITDRAFDALKCTGSGDGAECYGNGAVANQVASTAIGSTAQASGVGATSLGNAATASGTNAMALGRGAQASHDASTAIGAGAQTTAASRITLGTETSTYQTPGLTLAEGYIGVITTDADGVLRVASFATENLPNTFCLGAGTGATPDPR